MIAFAVIHVVGAGLASSSRAGLGGGRLRLEARATSLEAPSCP